MKAGIIGARGFVGQALACALAEAGHDVVAISREWSDAQREASSRYCKVVRADSADPIKLALALQGCEVTIYLAYEGVPLEAGGDYLFEYRRNLEILNHALSACIQAGVARFVFVSSGGTVYGENLGRPSLESDPLKPISHYGHVKRLSEALIQSVAETSGDIEFTIARVSNPFGVGQAVSSRQGLIVTAMKFAAAGRPILAFCGGRQVRDYIAIEDVASALIECTSSANLRNEVINIGSGIGYSALDVLNKIGQVTGLDVRINHAEGRAQDVDSNVLNISKLSQLTAWRPRAEFDEAIERVWNAVRARAMEN